MIKIDSKIIISICLPKLVKHGIGDLSYFPKVMRILKIFCLIRKQKKEEKLIIFKKV